MKKRIILSVFVSVFLSAMFGAPFAVTAASSGGANLIMGTTDSVESAIDPALSFDYFGLEIILNTGCGLVETEPGTDNIVPALATDWSVSGDGLTWNFTLRQGVLYEDGTEFNATYVKYSFDRSMGISSPDGPQVNIGYMDIIKNVTVISKYVVQFNLKIPFSPFLGLMACPASFIVNPKYAPFDEVVYYTEGDARASTPMDLGPYKLTKWTRVAGKDTEMWLEANPNYWRTSYPKTEKIIIKFYADATALRLAIEACDIDIAFRHFTAADIEDFKDDPDLKVWQGTGAAIQFLVFQEDPLPDLPQLDDARIRRAIAAALNRLELCETVFLGQTIPLYSMIPTGMMGHTEAFKTLGDANYTRTRELLAGLGYNATNKLQIELWYETSGHYPSSPDQAELYKEQLEASGVISVTLKSADWPSYRTHRNEGTMHVFIYGWYLDYIDPDDYAFLYWASWINHHYAKYNATNLYFNMTAAYDAARATTNETLREELYAELEDYAVMDCPVVPLWQGKAWAVTKPYIQGVYLDVTEILRMWYLYPTIRSFDIPWNGETYTVTMFSLSTITDFNFSQAHCLISFNVTGPDGTTGFCNVTIPNEFLGGPYIVLVDNSSVTPDPIWTLNGTHSFIYFTYTHSTHKVEIIGTTVIPEFPSTEMLTLFMTIIAIAIILSKIIRSRSPSQSQSYVNHHSIHRGMRRKRIRKEQPSFQKNIDFNVPFRLQ